MSARPSATVARMPVEPPSSPWAFPPPAAWPDDDDLVAMGADLAPGTLLRGLPQRALPDAVGHRAAATRWRGSARSSAGCCPSTGCGSPARCAAPLRTFEVRVDTAFADVVARLRRPAPAGRLDLGGHRGGVRRPPRAGLGALRRDLARRPAGGWAVRRRHRRPLRGRVDVPPRAGRVEGRPRRPGRAAQRRVRRPAAARRAVAHPAPGRPGRGRRCRGRPTWRRLPDALAVPAATFGPSATPRLLEQAAHPPVGERLAAGLAGRAVLQARVGEADLAHGVAADRALLAGAAVHREVRLLLALQLARRQPARARRRRRPGRCGSRRTTSAARRRSGCWRA